MKLASHRLALSGEGGLVTILRIMDVTSKEARQALMASYRDRIGMNLHQSDDPDAIPMDIRNTPPVRDLVLSPDQIQILCDSLLDARTTLPCAAAHLILQIFISGPDSVVDMISPEAALDLVWSLRAFPAAMGRMLDLISSGLPEDVLSADSRYAESQKFLDQIRAVDLTDGIQLHDLECIIESSEILTESHMTLKQLGLASAEVAMALSKSGFASFGIPDTVLASIAEKPFEQRLEFIKNQMITLSSHLNVAYKSAVRACGVFDVSGLDVLGLLAQERVLKDAVE
ncbi:hypothetical protein J8273_4915 [Carpediemonas membranifera]|uniref:Uncharacterized protein n=1 Tax=Carpediemonas membranifera TaxID=201153 RepID=A0A8J6AST9_9EUKA|nr:hypothetical protein J8273_4915 [Carpediemonas membranifera]|eukprot:KAG9393616.1 hypothetical protein J8273_4915 [Carpediemonas membranifera]